AELCLLPWIREPPLLANRFARTLAGSGIGLGALAPDRQAATMANAAVGTEVHQALDVHRHFTAQVAFHRHLADFVAQGVELILAQVTDLGGRTDTSNG